MDLFKFYICLQIRFSWTSIGLLLFFQNEVLFFMTQSIFVFTDLNVLYQSSEMEYSIFFVNKFQISR